MKQIVIINKYSRQMRRNRKAFIQNIKQEYPDLEYVVIKPKYLRRKVAQAVNEGYERVIVSGGDGSIATAASVLAKTHIELGIIPGGTTNSFARSLGIPMDTYKALKVATKNNAEACNLGSVNGHYFISVAALGLSEQVASTIPDSLKKRLGRLSYILWGTTKFLSTKPFTAKLDYGSKTKTIQTHQLIVANARLHGSLPVAKDAHVSKDELVVLSFGKDGSKLKHLKNLILYSQTKHDNSKGVMLNKVKELTLTTKPTKKVEIDGEVVTKTPAHFKLEKDALQIVRAK